MNANQGLPSEEINAGLLLESALSALVKAMKAMNFYPMEHPLRDENVAVAMLHLKPLVNEKELVLLWSRDGCSLADGGIPKNSSATARVLAKEMLTRKLQRLIILPSFSGKDLKAFLTVITADPAAIFAAGGIEKAISSAGITSICANEVNLSLLRGVSEEGSEEAAALVPTGIDEQNEDDDAGGESPLTELPDELSTLGIDILLGMLKTENRETQFLQLAREVIDASEEIKRQQSLVKLFPVIVALLDIYADLGRPTPQREFIRYSLEQIASGAMTTLLLDRLEERSPEDEQMLDALCTVIGQSLAYPLIQRLCVAESLRIRKALAISLTKSGRAAISALVAMLKDERWYVVRNMVTILGEIDSPDSLKALCEVADHPAPKVRKEVIKSIVKNSRVEGEGTIISMLNDSDKDVVKQAIFSLGAIRSKTAVHHLLEIAVATDTFLKQLEIKKLAVAALGKIGDRQATEPLLGLLTTRGWFAPQRWMEIKVAAAASLGQIGDESALPVLKRMGGRNSSLGEACSDAADNIERVVK